MTDYSRSYNEVLETTGSSTSGLSRSEADARLSKGKNKLVEGKKTSLIRRFLSQMADPMTIILIVAAAVSGITAVYSGEGFADVIIILVVVIINAVLGVYQESKAEQAIEALQKMAASTSRVIRDGVINVIKTEDIVVGDIVLLEAGDSVPADGRIIECAGLQAEEAALTGESVPVYKTSDAIPGEDIPLGDRKNMAYSGSIIVYGRGKMVVTQTGMDTEMGKIADALSRAEDGQTPLQKKLSSLSKILTYLVVGICAFIFVFSLIRSGSFDGSFILDTFMVAVSLAVAAIPEGLATVVTIVLSVGVTNMSKHGAIIRKLTAVETLGCAQVICSDKTGTLTQNKMTVTDSFGKDIPLLAKALSLCSDAQPDESGAAVGEPTEAALVNYATSLSFLKPQMEAESPRVAEAPFDSMRKMMSTIHSCNGSFVQYTKGATDVILQRCSMVWDGEKAVPMTKSHMDEILSENKSYADKALRVLSAAMRVYDTLPADTTPAALETDLIYIGFVGMIDPIRPEVKAAIEQCKTAGITTVMITGDHIDTARAIATQLGILTQGEMAITGAQLDDISDDDLLANIENYRVYARVQPEHKVRIVKAWQAKGYIAAMTGDGVNDAPSIKNADIGVGMGITGTDVTKNVADMVLSDDNFATIVRAVKEGRRIYDNIRKSIQFLLSSNASEVIGIFAATIMGFTLLKPVHLLWINLITDCIPALALGFEHSEHGIMNRAPRSSTDGVFAGGVGFDTIYQGFLVASLTIFAYFAGHFMETGIWEIVQSPHGMTMAFLTLSLAEVFHCFNMRSQRGSIFTVKGHNKILWCACIASIVLTAAVIYIPFLATAFGFTSISLPEYLVAFGIAFLVVPIVECVKLLQRKFGHRI